MGFTTKVSTRVSEKSVKKFIRVHFDMLYLRPTSYGYQICTRSYAVMHLCIYCIHKTCIQSNRIHNIVHLIKETNLSRRAPSKTTQSSHVTAVLVCSRPFSPTLASIATNNRVSTANLPNPESKKKKTLLCSMMVTLVNWNDRDLCLQIHVTLDDEMQLRKHVAHDLDVDVGADARL